MTSSSDGVVTAITTERPNRKALVTCAEPQCGKKFRAQRSTHRFCSKRHADAARKRQERERKADAVQIAGCVICDSSDSVKTVRTRTGRILTYCWAHLHLDALRKSWRHRVRELKRRIDDNALEEFGLPSWDRAVIRPHEATMLDDLGTLWLAQHGPNLERPVLELEVSRNGCVLSKYQRAPRHLAKIVSLPERELEDDENAP